MLKKTKSGWEYLEFVSETENAQTFIMFHGYGDDANQLNFLTKLYPEGRWIFPQAKLDNNNVKSWFDINPELFQEALKMDSSVIDKDLLKRKEKIVEMINEFNLINSEIIIGGFSQGACVAASIAMTNFVPKALIVLSGGSTLEIFPDKLPKTSKFFQSHGRQDPTLPYRAGEILNQKLLKQGWQGEFYSYDGLHEISAETVAKLQIFINSLDLSNRIQRSS